MWRLIFSRHAPAQVADASTGGVGTATTSGPTTPLADVVGSAAVAAGGVITGGVLGGPFAFPSRGDRSELGRAKSTGKALVQGAAAAAPLP